MTRASRLAALCLILVTCAGSAAPPSLPELSFTSEATAAPSALPTPSQTPTPTPVPKEGAVLVGAGDIASCALSGARQTAELLDHIPGAVFTAGDNAYENGSPTDFEACYDPSWGRHKDRTRPAIGNHEYNTLQAEGYFAYFAAARGPRPGGYYSYDLGAWHIVVLNSNCMIVECAPGSAQEIWLRLDLKAHPSRCTLAIWHHPLYSSGVHGNDVSTRPLWTALYEAGADVVINGHDHDYERFAPQDPFGQADPVRGIREFVVGTGGASLRGPGRAVPNSEVLRTGSWGVLKLTLFAEGYEWEFVPLAGPSLDSGGARCH